MTGQQTRTRVNLNSLPIETAIVEDHCDVVPFIYAYYRHKKIRQSALMVHFDSHPDLSVPSGKFSISDWRNSETLLHDILTEVG